MPRTSPTQDVLRGAADEVLSVLKSKDLKDPEKQAGVEELLGPLGSDKMAQLVAIGKLITDWVGSWGWQGRRVPALCLRCATACAVPCTGAWVAGSAASFRAQSAFSCRCGVDAPGT